MKFFRSRFTDFQWSTSFGWFCVYIINLISTPAFVHGNRFHSGSWSEPNGQSQCITYRSFSRCCVVQQWTIWTYIIHIKNGANVEIDAQILHRRSCCISATTLNFDNFHRKYKLATLTRWKMWMKFLVKWTKCPMSIHFYWYVKIFFYFKIQIQWGKNRID